MEGKNNEVRITIIVVVVLFVAILLASLWSAHFNTVAFEGEGASEVDAGTVRDAMVAPAASSGHSGKLVLNNKLLAAEAYRSAAEEGNAEAQYKLGDAYSNSRVVPLDPMALVWYRKSAAQGFGLAQNRLGVIYQHTDTSPRYLVVAYALYRMAATNPIPPADASANLAALKKSMSAQQITDGEALADKLGDLDDFLQTLDRTIK